MTRQNSLLPLNQPAEPDLLPAVATGHEDPKLREGIKRVMGRIAARSRTD